MRAQMMDMPLLVSSLIAHADRSHGDTEIVSRTVEGPIHRYTYSEAHRRSKRLAQALTRLGVKQSERVGTFAWNGFRHFELYYGVAGMGAVIHTVNPRLFPEQLVFIVNDAEDRYVFFDLTFAPLVEKLAPACKGVKGWVAMTDRAHMPQANLPNLLCYEELIAREDGDYEWPQFDDWTAAGLCYTSGTTGNPKGVLYANRSTILHAYAASLPDVFNCSARSVILPVVPMFHVNAWGVPYFAPLNGAKLVFPGAGLDGKNLYELFEAERVTASAGVPTVWLALLAHMKQNNLKFSTLKSVVVGGSACPPAMIDAFRDGFGVHWILKEYFKGAGGSPLRDGWFPTGDVATIDPEGYMQITDRSKDVIKSGGEWISSIDLENIAVAHPAIAEAAVIGVRHPKWDERPLVIAVRKPGASVTREDLLGFYAGKVAKWWMPDDVVFVEQLPHTATGKLLKTK